MCSPGNNNKVDFAACGILFDPPVCIVGKKILLTIRDSPGTRNSAATALQNRSTSISASSS